MPRRKAMSEEDEEKFIPQNFKDGWAAPYQKCGVGWEVLGCTVQDWRVENEREGSAVFGVHHSSLHSGEPRSNMGSRHGQGQSFGAELGKP
jgi:hypothetical protein